MPTRSAFEDEGGGCETAAQPYQSGNGRPRKREFSIGMFHPTAGKRNASGVSMFVEEATRHLAETGPTYLYSGYDSLTGELAQSDVTAVRIRRNPGWEYIKRMGSRLPFTLRSFSSQVSESTSAVINAAIDGKLGHIERNVDVLFTHHLAETILLSNSVTVPVVRVMHGCRHVGLGAKSERYLSSVAATIANSQQTARELSEQLDCEVDGIAHPGVRTERFTPDTPPAFERDEPVIMFVGRFVQSKGIYDLLEAVATLPDKVYLSLVGRGNEREVRKRIAELGISDRVTVEGEIDHSRLPRYYTAADVVCLPSYYESFGMVNLEAMACATPVITTDLPGIRTYATDDETCLLITPGDVDALTNQLARLLLSPELQDRLGRAGRATAKQFTWETTAKRLSRIAERVLSADSSTIPCDPTADSEPKSSEPGVETRGTENRYS